MKDPKRPFYLSIALRGQKAVSFAFKDDDGAGDKGDKGDKPDDADESDDEEDTTAQAEARFKKELKRRTDAIRKNLRAELENDDEFVQSLIAKKGGAKPKPDQAAHDKLIADLRKAEVDPLKSQLEEASGSLSKLQTRVLESSILVAAQGVIKPELLKAVGKRGKAAILSTVADDFKYDPETGEHYAVDEDGEFVLSRTGKARYQTVSEYFEAFAKDKKNADFLVDAKQRGPGLGGTSGEKRGGVVRISREDARISSKYQAAVKEAEKIGGTVEIEG